jgi:hypothetical protein
VVRGTTSDDGVVEDVRVNGHAARALGPNFGEWEVILEGVANSCSTPRPETTPATRSRPRTG